MIGYASKIIDKLSSDYQYLDISEHEIKIVENTKWTLIYEENRSNCYWIAMSSSGVLIDGWSKTRVGECVFRRIIKLEPIDSCACNIAQIEVCYSSDGRLDFNTLKILCISLSKFCYDHYLESFIDSLISDFDGLPFDETSFF